MSYTSRVADLIYAIVVIGYDVLVRLITLEAKATEANERSTIIIMQEHVTDLTRPFTIGDIPILNTKGILARLTFGKINGPILSLEHSTLLFILIQQGLRVIVHQGSKLLTGRCGRHYLGQIPSRSHHVCILLLKIHGLKNHV